MIGRGEIERSFVGAWRVFLGKPDALSFFDTGIDGFWRSFQAILLVAPIYFVNALADRTGAFGSAVADGPSPEAFWAAQAATLILDWAALPTLLAAIAGLIGIKRQYPAYIVVRNWAAVLMVAPFAAVSALESFGLSDDIMLVPSLAALAFSFRFGYLIARQALNASVDVAIALVALDVLVSLAVVKAVGWVTGVAPFA